MEKIAASVKIALIWIYNGFASVIVHGAIQASLTDRITNSGQLLVITIFSLLMILLPEILFLVRFFIKRVLFGIKFIYPNLGSDEMKEFIMLYSSLWCIRIFMGFSIAIVFGVDIPTLIYIIPLLGSFGTAGLAMLKNFMGK